MDTTVITVEPADYGVGSSDRVTFVDTKYTVDDDGNLHVFAEQPTGNVAAFPKGSWRAVLRGTLCHENDVIKVAQP